jgi:plastocyanin
MRLKKKITLGLLLAMSIVIAHPCHAAVQTVTVQDFQFSPAQITINIGDTIHWVWMNGSHTTTSGNSASCTPDGKWSAPLDSTHPTFDHTFFGAGVYNYFCIPHCAMGMVGTVTVVLPVKVADFQFSPANVTVKVGDTVRWIWVNGSHTTTSGNSGTCTPNGTWNAPINQTNPTFDFTFTTPGTFDYFCIPHCQTMGMAGSVRVLNPADVPPHGGAFPELGASPNPFGPMTEVSFSLREAGIVNLEVFDAGGRRVATLGAGTYGAGAHQLVWNGKSDAGEDLPAGVYYAREWITGQRTSSVVLVKVR